MTPPIPPSRAAAIARADADAAHAGRVVQLRWRPIGKGMVELVYTRGEDDFGYATGLILSWPQQGTVVGDPPRDEQNALKLNGATLVVNRTLRELCS